VPAARDVLLSDPISSRVQKSKASFCALTKADISALSLRVPHLRDLSEGGICSSCSRNLNCKL
jgi:hypothetical protein